MSAAGIPIRRQLIKMMLLTGGAVVLFTSGLFVLADVVTFKQNLVRQLDILSEAVARNSTAALAFDNAADARVVLSAFGADRHIRAAALYDQSGAVFASYPEGAHATVPKAPLQLDGARFEDGHVLVFNRVALESEPALGTLMVKSDLSAIDDRFALYGIIVLGVLVLGALLAWIVARQLQGQISRPILGLAGIARAVSDRNDYGVRAPPAELLEISQLTDAFNHMLGQVQAGEHRLLAQMSRLSLLQHITAAIGDRHDLKSIFQVVLSNVEENLPLDFGCVCEYDASNTTISVSAVGPGSRALGVELGLVEGVVLPVDGNGLTRCTRGELVYEPDVRSVGFPFPQRFAEMGLTSLVIAPLAIEATVFGVFVAARRKCDAFSSGECEFLKQLGSHVALASHQLRLHGALRQAYDDLRQSQTAVMQQERLRALGQMASGIAHDINNAISPVSIYTESLLEREPNLSPRARAALEVIQRAIDGVAATVARMREFYRPREPQMTLTEVDLNELLEQVIELTHAKWSALPQQRGVSIELQRELAPDLPRIMGAEGEIRDALTNLIFNAVDAMPDGGTLTARTSVTLSSGDLRLVTVEVTDTGVGMDEETRRRCLEPFFTTKGERGTGLGLAMVYGMIQRHSAQFEIHSAVGKGTTIQITFPAYSLQATGTARVAQPQAIMRRLRVLVVDDDPIIIKALEDALGGDGHMTVAATGGQAALDAFAAAHGTENAFALVISDLGMPNVDGRRVAAGIKQMSPATPVVLLTGWGARMIDEDETPAHVDRVLAKPPRLHDLRGAILDLVG
jgi:signal transduction histidine kinase/ActR/RegA family two-component response regulator